VATLSTIDALVVPLINDEAGVLAAAVRKGHIGSALVEYQKRRPLIVVYELTGAAAYEYAVSLFSGWSDGLSYFARIEGPIVSGSNVPPRSLDADEYSLVRTPSGLFLRFRCFAPASGQQYWVHYATAHTLTESASTVFAADETALAELGAAYCCDALAARYAQGTDGSIEADTVNHDGKAEIYKGLSKMYRERFDAKVPAPNRQAGHRWIVRA
jgi:hypothetical protein